MGHYGPRRLPYFRVLDIADLSVEGTFPLGAAVAATLIDAGHSVWFAMLIALIAGCIGGTVTALLTTKLKIPALLSGILTMIGLYSVNLMIMGKANVPLLRAETVFTLTEDLFGVSSVVATLIVGLIATTVVGVIMYWFFGTVLGTAIRATGCNPQMARAQGINTNVMVILGLLISNGLVALSGALVAQSNGFADVGMGTGTIVIGLASVIIGEVLFGTRSFKNWLISVVLGSVVYRCRDRHRSGTGHAAERPQTVHRCFGCYRTFSAFDQNKFAIMKRSEEADA